MTKTTPHGPRSRHIHDLREVRHDTYKLKAKLPEPTVCPSCGACYIRGRWIWAERPEGDVNEHKCPACLRTEDNYPAGEVRLRGAFVKAHHGEIANLVRNTEAQERAEHPLNRIMAIEDDGDAMIVLTTDIHLPRRIGDAVNNAWNGDLETHYDDDGYFVRVTWQRDA
jgi:NMD protein affecting ribosome stability and mRNA decay